LVRIADWLLKRENWRRYWLAIIIAALFIGALPAGRFLADHGVKIFHVEQRDNGGRLPEENARRAIMAALHNSDLKEVLRLLRELEGSPARSEECQHAFAAFMKKEEFGAAQSIVSNCWNGEAKEEKLSEIKVAKQRAK
jgi:hypothetical protein